MRRADHRTRLLVFALAALLLALPQQSFALGVQHRRAAREEILLLEKQWRNAQLNDDFAAMDKLLSDDYLGITPQGDVLTKTQQLERMRSRELSITALEATDIKIKLVGQVAIVTSLAHVRGASDTSPLNGEYRYTRIYQHLPSGSWKITNFEITRVRKVRDQNSD